MTAHFLQKYKEVGEQKFYSFLLTYALNKLILINAGTYKGVSPELELLDFYEKIMILYRRDGDTSLLEVAKLFRRAAHKIYRVMLKKNITQKNLKFLNVV